MLYSKDATEDRYLSNGVAIGIGVQFAKFAVVGLANTAVDLSCYFLLTRFAGLHGDLIYIAKAVSFSIATLNSYALNRSWTFNGSHPFSWRHLGKFYAVVGSGIVVNVGIHAINIALFGLPDLASVVVAATGTALWGFALAKRFVFV